MKKVLLNIPMAVMFLILFHPAAYTYNVPDTGQTICYNASGTVVSCTNTGQDGEYSINPMSFADHGNGTVTDNTTGLMWQKCSAGQNATTCSGTATTYNWYRARGIADITYNPLPIISVCGSLVLASYSDWRLPTKKELTTIEDYSVSRPGPTIKGTYFPNTKTTENYWSSDTLASNTDNAWFASFWDGLISNSDPKSTPNYVRCVRGGQTAQGLIDNGNGTVTDAKTCLMWQKAETDGMAWSDALDSCNVSTLAAYTDWRMPNLKELESLADDSQYNPAINTDYFPNAHAGIYWSSTSYVYYPDHAWYVAFDATTISAVTKDTAFIFVRCVRGGQTVENFVKLVSEGSPDVPYGTLEDAYAASDNGDSIRAKAIVFIGNQTFSRDVTVTLKGGHDCGFASNPGFTSIAGSVTIKGGTVTVENLTIK
jgi:hypothetical protein